MVKEPHPGRVKTRLARDIGRVQAAWWFRHQTGALLRRLADPRWRIVLAVTPEREGLASRVWPPELARIPQGRGDLGQRMLRAMRCAGRGPVCLIGADIPGLRRRHIARAFAALGASDAVFGPATDGGYWLIGLKHPRRARHDFLTGVRWSTEHALDDSLASAPGLRISFADTLSDVDTAADLALPDDAHRAPW
jgi:rSAM/selenodomain-associated transferase 1